MHRVWVYGRLLHETSVISSNGSSPEPRPSAASTLTNGQQARPYNLFLRIAN